MASILIIDDRPTNRQFLTTLLGYRNHQIMEASDGAEGLHLASVHHPDLIISDVLMPTMDGYEFVRQLRLNPDIRNTRVIFSTAHFLSRESQALARACGVTSIIYKPSEPADVLRIVDDELGAGPTTPIQPAQTEEFDREHLQLLTNKLSEKADQLRETNAKLTALVELSAELAKERDPAELLDRYCSVAREVIGVKWSLVALLEKDRRSVEHVSVTGIDLAATPELRSGLLETGLFVTLLNEGRTIRIHDNSSAETALSLPDCLPRAGSLLIVPLAMRERIYGWLCLVDKLGLDAFSEQDEKLATAFAVKMAIAYDNAELYAHSTSYATKLETEISERAKAERQLSESRARLAGIINSAMDSIITIDSDQRVLMFNRAAETMFRCTADEAIGQTLDRFIPPRFRSHHSRDIRKFGDTGVTTRAMAAARPISGLRADGDEFPLEASISQIEIGGQKLYTVIMRDIAERKRAEGALKAANQRLEQALTELQSKRDELAAMTQQLWQASKLATMGELAASIAHELNNPLATLALRAEFLHEQMPPDDPKQRAVTIITEEVDRMATLVGNLLQFSRRSHAQISTLDIREELTNSIDLIHYHLRSRKVKVVREFADKLPAVQGDRQRLRQVFLNLLTNATDAMPEGGTLTLRVHAEVLDSNARMVIVQFIDTGMGIHPDQLQQIWEPFFTTKPEGKGTGLGLPICRRTIEEHRGTIDVQSEPNQGTKIRIHLPLNNATPFET